MEIINNYLSESSNSIAALATTLEVSIAPVGVVPTLASPLTLTLFSAIDSEIVHCTNISGTTLTILRAQEGTTALSWSANTKVAGMLTAGVVKAVVGRGLGILESVAGSVVVAANGIINIPNIGIMLVAGQSVTLPTGQVALVTSVGNDDQITVSGHLAGSESGTFTAVVPDGRKLRYYNGHSVWRS